MNNPWKLATIGMALTATTALVTGVTTAYFIRPSTPESASVEAPKAGAAPATSTGPMAPPPPPMATATIPAATAPVPVAAPAPVSTVSVPADCATGGDRALRIAKPGLLGSLIGAGMGAAGGAIADGGKGAGKGALIGGLAGAVLGSGYGAYKTREDCGTIFGGADAMAAPPALSPAERVPTPQAALRPTTDERIAIYSSR